MYTFEVEGPDGSHYKENLSFETREEAINWFKKEHKLYDEGSNYLVDPWGQSWSIVRKLSQSARYLQELYDDLWEYEFETIKDLPEDDLNMLSYTVKQWLGQLTKPEYDLAVRELVNSNLGCKGMRKDIEQQDYDHKKE